MPHTKHILCALALALSILSCLSCSHKTTSSLHQLDSLSLSHITTLQLSTSDSLSQIVSNYQHVLDSINTYWSTHKTITYYSTPDSLGNQFVTHIEEADSQGGSSHISSTTTQDSTTVIESSTSNTNTTDTLYITKTHTITKTLTNTLTPWYYKYSLYFTLISIFAAITYLLWSNRARIIKLLTKL